MADSKRQRIVDAVVERLKLIDGTGDYDSDVEDRVEDSRTNWDQSELPAISVFDGDALATPTSEGRYRGVVHVMSVLIRYFAEQGATAANVRTGIKDIQTAIRVDDKFSVEGDPLVMQTRQVRDGILRNAESFEVEGAEVEIEVQFITKKFNAEE